MFVSRTAAGRPFVRQPCIADLPPVSRSIPPSINSSSPIRTEVVPCLRSGFALASTNTVMPDLVTVKPYVKRMGLSHVACAIMIV